ncbi:MAG: hypothetical protein N2999_05800 [Proteobacteria bacterium]|nr:hypothetical protein [Pseudomonadota bacterium]
MSQQFSIQINQFFPYKLIDGHIIVKDKENEIVIDTGSPISIVKSNYRPPFFLLKRVNFLENEILLDEISNKIRTCNLSAIIGSDVLSSLDISIDPLGNTIMISEPRDKDDIESFYTDKIMLSIRTIMNIPVIDLDIEGAKRKMFLDTGAKISYLKENLIKDMEPVIKNVSDFSPFNLEEFTTDLYEKIIKVGNSKINLKFGTLPSSLSQKLLLSNNVDGILGTAILKNCSVYLSLANRFVCIANLPEKVMPEGTKERWTQRLRYTSNMYLRDSDLAETMPEDCKGYLPAIEIIQRKMLSLTTGSMTHTYLMNLLNRILN